MGFSGRKRKSSAKDSIPSVNESLAPFLLRGLAWGIYSAVQVQQIAAASRADYERHGYEPPATRLIYLYIHVYLYMFQFFFSKPFMYCIPILYFNNLPSITYLFNICLRRRCVSSAPWEAVENISTIAGETCCCTWANRIFQDLYPLKPSSSMAKNSRVALCLFCFLTKCLQRCIIITLEHGTNIFFLLWMQRRNFGLIRQEPRCSKSML